MLIIVIKSLLYVALECLFCYCATYVVYHQEEYSRLKTVLLKTMLIIMELLIVFGFAFIIVKDALQQ